MTLQVDVTGVGVGVRVGPPGVIVGPEVGVDVLVGIGVS